jgi:hypothetical protein
MATRRAPRRFSRMNDLVLRSIAVAAAVLTAPVAIAEEL